MFNIYEIINKWIKYYLILLLLLLSYAKSLEIDITTYQNDINNINNLCEIINLNCQNGKKIVLNFKENYYFLRHGQSNDITVSSNIHFIGNKNKTVLDFSNGEYTNMRFIINPTESEKLYVYFENIIFKNFNKIIPFETEFSLMFIASNDNYQVHFENCIFENNNLPILSSSGSLKRNHDFYQIIFNNCEFK